MRESRQRLRLAAEAAKLGWYSYDVQADQVDWSDELYTLLKISLNDKVSINRIAEFTHLDDRPHYLAHCRKALERESETDYRGEFRAMRGDGQKVWLEDRGTVIWGGEIDDRRPRYAVGMVTDITERKATEAKLHDLNRTLEEQVADRTAVLEVLQDITRAANESQTVTEAMEAALRRIAQYNGWKIGHVWQAVDGAPPVDGVAATMESSGVWHADNSFSDQQGVVERLKRLVEKKKIHAGEGLIGKVIESGKTLWMEHAKDGDEQHFELEHTSLQSVVAFPITIDGEVAAVMEFLSDKETGPSGDLLKVIPDIGIQLGHVIERKRLERIVSELAINEQQRIGRELHDSVAQQLTGGALIAQAHKGQLVREASPSVGTAQQLIEIIDQAHRDVRHLSSGLMLSTMSSDGLLLALQATASETRNRFGVACELRTQEFDENLIGDNRVAIAMLQIAREAIHNAVKHAQAQTITIELHADDEIIMVIRDDGIGFVDGVKSKGSNGLRIMRYRAESIGGRLVIKTQPGDVTTITFNFTI